MNRLITYFLMAVLLILVSCIDPEMNEPGMPPDMVEPDDNTNNMVQPDDNTLPPPEVLPAIEIIGAEKDSSQIMLPSDPSGNVGATETFSHRIRVRINRDINALRLETDQSDDFSFITLSSTSFGLFDPTAVTSNTITAGTEIFVYPDNKSASASVSNFTVTKSEIYFYNDSGDQEVIESVENTMFSNL